MKYRESYRPLRGARRPGSLKPCSRDRYCPGNGGPVQIRRTPSGQPAGPFGTPTNVPGVKPGSRSHVQHNATLLYKKNLKKQQAFKFIAPCPKRTRHGQQTQPGVLILGVEYQIPSTSGRIFFSRHLGNRLIRRNSYICPFRESPSSGRESRGKTVYGGIPIQGACRRGLDKDQPYQYYDLYLGWISVDEPVKKSKADLLTATGSNRYD